MQGLEQAVDVRGCCCDTLWVHCMCSCTSTDTRLAAACLQTMAKAEAKARARGEAEGRGRERGKGRVNGRVEVSQMTPRGNASLWASQRSLTKCESLQRSQRRWTVRVLV